MRTPLKFIVVPYILKAIIILIAATCRVRVHNQTTLDALSESGTPFILAFWHNVSTLVPWATRERAQFTCIVSASRDGEYVSRLGTLFGAKTVRGSSSKGSSGASRALLRLLMKGDNVAITPDGPRGPVYSVQGGVVWLSSAQSAPILPLHIEASRQWVLKSWDRHRFFKPFSTIHVRFGEPLTISKEEFKKNPETAAEKVQKALMENVHKVQAAAGQPLD